VPTGAPPTFVSLLCPPCVLGGTEPFPAWLTRLVYQPAGSDICGLWNARTMSCDLTWAFAKSKQSDTPTYSEPISKWFYGGGQVPGVVWDLCQTAPFGSIAKACVRRSVSRAKSSCRSPTLGAPNGWSGPHWPDGRRSACQVE
jgi:hypothetical protein